MAYFDWRQAAVVANMGRREGTPAAPKEQAGRSEWRRGVVAAYFPHSQQLPKDMDIGPEEAAVVVQDGQIVDTYHQKRLTTGGLAGWLNVLAGARHSYRMLFVDLSPFVVSLPLHELVTRDLDKISGVARVRLQADFEKVINLLGLFRGVTLLHVEDMSNELGSLLLPRVFVPQLARCDSRDIRANRQLLENLEKECCAESDKLYGESGIYTRGVSIDWQLTGAEQADLQQQQLKQQAATDKLQYELNVMTQREREKQAVRDNLQLQLAKANNALEVKKIETEMHKLDLELSDIVQKRALQHQQQRQSQEREHLEALAKIARDAELARLANQATPVVLKPPANKANTACCQSPWQCGAADCPGTTDEWGICPHCFAPAVMVDTGYTVRSGQQGILAARLFNQGQRPFGLRRLGHSFSGNGEQVKNLVQEIMPGQMTELFLPGFEPTRAGHYLLHLQLGLESQGELWTMEGELPLVGIQEQEERQAIQSIHIEHLHASHQAIVDVGAGYTSAHHGQKVAHAATWQNLELRLALPTPGSGYGYPDGAYLTRATQIHVPDPETGQRQLLRFHGKKSLAFGRNRPGKDPSADVDAMLRIFPRNDYHDQLTKMISGRHFELVLKNGQLSLRTISSKVTSVNETVLHTGMEACIQHGDKISPFSDMSHVGKYAWQVAFHRQGSKVEIVELKPVW